MKKHKNEGGFALVLSLVLLLTMSLLGGSLILISSEDHKSNDLSDNYLQTFYSAELGIRAGERYLLNQFQGPYDANGVRVIADANLPRNMTTNWDQLMNLNYADLNYVSTPDSGNRCFNSFSNITRANFRIIASAGVGLAAQSSNFGSYLAESGIDESFDFNNITIRENDILRNFYYEYFITQIGDAKFQGTGTSVKKKAKDSGLDGIGYKIYACGIYDDNNIDQRRIIVPLESLVILPK